MKKFLPILLLSLFTACGLSNNPTDDTAARQLTSSKLQESSYSKIKGDYTLILQSDSDKPTNNHCAYLHLDSFDETVGFDANGKPVLQTRLIAQYTDADSLFYDELLDAQYFDSGLLSLSLPSEKSKDRILNIKGLITNNSYSGNIKILESKGGGKQLRFNTDFNSSCPSKTEYIKNIDGQISEYFSGTWDGLSEEGPDANPHHLRLKIDVMGTIYGPQIRAFFTLDPLISGKPIEVKTNLRWYQDPVGLIFESINPQQDPVKFSGYVTQKNEIVGIISYPTFSAKTVFKRISK